MSSSPQHEVLVVAILVLCAGVLGIHDHIAYCQFHRHAVAVVGEPAGADCADFRFLRLLFGGVGYVDAA